ncbi:cGMP-inhibited 3',5'-cyclic phosphodiesterase A isoform X4 [Folsomia candida]|uniref:cGMP-inhibited 3',5'-cyclic phosphodiesterase A isoform X4 n=1 Tax=Folsomia candida TaxID=158441 RepID=UPI0016052B1F|nr:cGMP-inhibited 3',5'-cyclic phosphodiesterase A isoform X4 [Folsomia candida]
MMISGERDLFWRELFYEWDWATERILSSWGRVARSEFDLVRVLVVGSLMVFFAFVLLLLLAFGNTSSPPTSSGGEAESSGGDYDFCIGTFCFAQEAEFLTVRLLVWSSFALSVSCTLVCSAACLSFYLYLQSAAPTNADHPHLLRSRLPQGYFWKKFGPPVTDRPLFSLFWTGVLVDLWSDNNTFLHALFLWIVLKALNYLHHRTHFNTALTFENPNVNVDHGGVKFRPPPQLLRTLDQSIATTPEEEALLVASCRVTLSLFCYFITVRRLGSLVWSSFPVLTHLLGILGLFFGQFLLCGIQQENKKDNTTSELIVRSLPSQSQPQRQGRRSGNTNFSSVSIPRFLRRPLLVGGISASQPGSFDSSPDETRDNVILASSSSSKNVPAGIVCSERDQSSSTIVVRDCEEEEDEKACYGGRRDDTAAACSEYNDDDDDHSSYYYYSNSIPLTREKFDGGDAHGGESFHQQQFYNGFSTKKGAFHRHSLHGNNMRRTSLPAALPAQRYSSIHQGSGVVDTALLYEAHGLVTEMLLDQASLPPNIVAGLKALATLLKPTPTPMHCSSRPRPAPLSITTDPEYTSDVDEIPYTGEKLSTMPKRNSGAGKKGVSANLLRRMSTSTWTTTTSATGMPTLEPQPHARRRRSASFRSAMEGTPPGSSPTQQYGLIPITLLENNKENNSLLPTTTTPAFATFKMGTPLTGSIAGLMSQQQPATSTPHIPNAALQASHKARSFSACGFAVNASTAGSNRSSPAGTPIPSPIPSPVPSRDHSPCNFSARRASDHPKPEPLSIVNLPPTSTTSASESRFRDYSPPKVIFQPEQPTPTGPGTTNDGDSLGLLSGRNLSTSPYLDNPDEDCSNASTLGDGPGPPDSSSGNSNSVRLSPVTFTLQEPTDNNDQEDELQDFRDAVIVTSDGFQFHLPTIAANTYLCRLGEWDYPIFDLERNSKTQILSHMTYKVFLETGLFDTFKIPIKEFINYFHALEMGYRNKPYHNRMHAADVLQGVFYFTTQAIPGFQMVPPDPDTPNSGKLTKHPDWSGQRACFNVDEASYGIMGANLPGLELMALYTAAAMHDYDHPGRTNAFLVTTNSPQAILYNDRSVLENHHAAAAWALLMNNENYNFLKFLDKAEFKRFRFLVIEAILATDLKRHFEIMSEFNSKVNEEESPGIDWTSEEDRLLVMEICIKLADINGPCKYHDIHVQWTYRIAEEFYEQGDEEVRLGLPISPFMDRYHPQLAKLQESFINHLVAPLCKACAEAGLLPGYWEDEVEDDQNEGEGETTADEISTMSFQEADYENEESSYSDDNKSDSSKSKRKIFCLHTKHLQDNHRYWMNVIKEEAKKKEEGVKTESVAISTEDPMETIEEENNTPHSLNRSFSFEKEDSKL